MAHSDPAGEPFAEYAVARRIEKTQGSFLSLRNPRRLHLKIGERAYEIRAWERDFFPRSLLIGEHPSGQLGEAQVRLIAEWTARRYIRAALPTSFNNRYKPIRERLKQAFDRDSEHLVAVLLRLDPPDRELPDSEDYSIALYFVADSLVENVADQNERLRRLVDKVERLLNECRGLVVVAADIFAESEITLEEFNNSVRWGDFDYLSYEMG